MITEIQEHSDSDEEILIYAEFDESVNIEKYRSIHVLGINQREPIIQADDTFFNGKFVHPLGTYMFFEEDPLSKSADPLFDKLPEKNLKYVFKTNKALSMEHAYVIPREGAEQIMKGEANDYDDIPTVKFASMEEALKAFKHIILKPISETNSAASTEVTPQTTTVSDQIENKSDNAMQT